MTKGEIFLYSIDKIQPTQLYINKDKMNSIINQIQNVTIDTIPPVPIYKLNDKVIYTDGHTRALLAHLNNLNEILVFWDTDDIDERAYITCMNWCVSEKILKIADLKTRIIENKEYQQLWIKRCENL